MLSRRARGMHSPINVAGHRTASQQAMATVRGKAGLARRRLAAQEADKPSEAKAICGCFGSGGAQGTLGYAYSGTVRGRKGVGGRAGGLAVAGCRTLRWRRYSAECVSMCRWYPLLRMPAPHTPQSTIPSAAAVAGSDCASAVG
jgi:hypothetical protein